MKSFIFKIKQKLDIKTNALINTLHNIDESIWKPKKYNK